MPTALIVDDNPGERKTIEKYLEARGVTYDLAGDGRTARDFIRSKQYDFIFLDLDLGAGILDGEGVLSWLDREGRHIPTIMISEAASLPAAIRLEQGYRHFVKFRMTHGDFEHLRDLVDELIAALNAGATEEDAGRARLEQSYTAAAEHRSWGDIWPWLIALMVVTGLVVLLTSLNASQMLLAVFAAVLLFALVAIIVLRRSGALSERNFSKIVSDIIGRASGRKNL
jgi:CheY-like chemotaxis protein